jgi:hypothetical protein
MTSGVDETTPKKAFENVAFINFNYDRCLEHFFLHAVAARFSISLVDAAKVSGDAFVIHPYGYLGEINPFSSQNRSYFGQTEYVDLAAVASRIRTYTEQHSEEDATVKDIHDAVSQADTLVFLGFAFHEQNLKLLAPNQGIKAKQIFATSKGMSENDINLTKSWMQSLSKNVTPLVQVEPESCADFIRKYQKSIAK